MKIGDSLSFYEEHCAKGHNDVGISVPVAIVYCTWYHSYLVLYLVVIVEAGVPPLAFATPMVCVLCCCVLSSVVRTINRYIRIPDLFGNLYRHGRRRPYAKPQIAGASFMLFVSATFLTSSYISTRTDSS